MARTGAERQSAFRQRQQEAAAALGSEAERLRHCVARLEAENGRLRREVDVLSAALDAEQAGAGGPPACPHPSESVDNGRCTECGEWL